MCAAVNPADSTIGCDKKNDRGTPPRAARCASTAGSTAEEQGSSLHTTTTLASTDYYAARTGSPIKNARRAAVLGSPCCALTGAAPRHAKDAPLWREQLAGSSLRRRVRRAASIVLVLSLRAFLSWSAVARSGLRLVRTASRPTSGRPARRSTGAHGPSASCFSLQTSAAQPRASERGYADQGARRTSPARASLGPARRGFKRTLASAAGAGQAATAERLRAAREARGQRRRGGRPGRLRGDRRWHRRGWTHPRTATAARSMSTAPTPRTMKWPS